jgi:hypothetical protein
MSTRMSVGRLVAALIVSATPLALLAANPHWKNGGQPNCSPSSGPTVTCSSAVVAGLGNFDVQVSMTFTATQGRVCHNKGNPDNFVRGQNPAIGTGGTGASFPAEEIKNGTLVVPEMTATAILTPGTAKSAGCPNANWTVTLEGPVTITGGVYTFQSPPGTTIPKLSFTF